MKTLHRWSVGLVLVVACVGCKPSKPPVTVNGFELSAKWWDKDSQAVRSRASFDLQCEASEIEPTVISTYPNQYTDVAQTIGASGCGKRATYLRPGSFAGWVMNSSNDDEETKQEVKHTAKR